MRQWIFALIVSAPLPTLASADCYRDVIEFSEGICAEFVGLSGSSASQKYSGELEARLSGLLDKLADVGGGGQAAIETEEYENILRTDVPRVLQEGRTCRLEVARLFFDKICASPTPSGRLQQAPAPDPRFASTAFIEDADGFTNVRSGPGTQYQIISRVSDGEPFYTRVQDGAWWEVKTATGAVGYMHRSRIRLRE